MDTTNSSLKSLDSMSSLYDESNPELKWNNAMLVSFNGEIISSSDDEIVVNVTALTDFERTSGTPITSNKEQRTDFSSQFEVDDSTRYLSLNSGIYSNCKNNEHSKALTPKHVPLKMQLKCMFNKILGKCGNSRKRSNTTSTKDSSTDCLLNNSNSPNKSDDRCENNNEDPQDASVSFLNKYYRKRLVTILENSDESSANSQTEKSSDWTAEYVGRLGTYNFHSHSKHCINAFNTSDMNDSQSSISSNMSDNVKILSKEIFQKANKY